MKSLIKLAVGAAIAGAVVSLLLKRRSRMSEEVASLDESVGLRGDEPAEGLVEIDVVTLTPVAEGREDWYGAQSGDSPRH
jgi:hypothetical protein